MRDGIYVAASSKPEEIERAKRCIARLQAVGLKVNSSWIENIAKVGDANPRDASDEQKQAWCLSDVRAALNSQVFWLLMPPKEHSFGATFEYAFFVALSPDEDRYKHVVSGDYKKTIFTSFSTCFKTDEEAFVAICELLGVPAPATALAENTNAAG